MMVCRGDRYVVCDRWYDGAGTFPHLPTATYHMRLAGSKQPEEG
jgi:hypothetical protein